MLPSGKETVVFFSSIQNKLHYVITGLNVAELMDDPFDTSESDMRMTSWACDRIYASDVTGSKELL
ncbi:RhuM family protein [Akkermansia sp.]|uniref:RhuM family protein n=1 Tax=Akkermansia sp. TaxID=1872421 RepID=UPI003A8FA633